ncbi:MAG: YhcH/YjgK/YiaL family protein [Opitutaceae bacterium]|nr:YhcH/YjgK/YiaL family protein [Opitutaceae bacterium]
MRPKSTDGLIQCCLVQQAGWVDEFGHWLCPIGKEADMICGRLCDFEALGLDACGPAIQRAVAWIRTLPEEPVEGAVALEEGMHALVLRCPTFEQATGRFETHRRHVDLQYTLAGCEALEWAPRAVLTEDGAYHPEKDVLFYQAGFAAGRIVASPGYFSIFTPWDAHRGGIRSDPSCGEVLKLVVKIPVGDFIPFRPHE